MLPNVNHTVFSVKLYQRSFNGLTLSFLLFGIASTCFRPNPGRSISWNFLCFTHALKWGSTLISGCSKCLQISSYLSALIAGLLLEDPCSSASTCSFCLKAGSMFCSQTVNYVINSLPQISDTHLKTSGKIMTANSRSVGLWLTAYRQQDFHRSIAQLTVCQFMRDRSIVARSTDRCAIDRLLRQRAIDR